MAYPFLRQTSTGSGAHAQREQNGCLRRFVDNQVFDAFFAVVVLTNSIFIGFEVEFGISPEPRPDFIRVLQYVYTASFAIELMLRISAFGRHFFCSQEWSWSLLDVFIVVTSLWEIGIEMSQGSSDTSGVSSLRALRVLRLTRILKTAQLIRIFRFVLALRTLVRSIAHTLKALFWALLLLAVIIYCFAVLFLQSVNGHITYLQDNGGSMDPKDAEASMKFFRSLPITMLSLFMSIAGGVSWHEVIEPLQSISLPLVFAYIFSFLLYTSLFSTW